MEQITTADVVKDLPAVREMPFDASAPRELDLLLCTLGFEDRCFAVPEALAEEGCRTAWSIVCTYATNRDDNELNRVALCRQLDLLGGLRRELASDSAGFAERLDEVLAEVVASCGGPLRVGWDISAASSQVVLKVIHALLALQCEVEVFYTEAAQYYPTREEFDDLRRRLAADDSFGTLETGTLEVRVAPEYPGGHSSHLGHFVIVIPGFNRDRVRTAISQVDPEFVSDLARAPIHWLISDPPAEDNAWRRDAQLLIHRIPEGQSQAVLSTFDYRSAMIALDVPYAQYARERNLTLCPMGSKLQALGAGLFCFAHPEIRVMFAQPARYTAGHYTEGVRAIWCVPLGSMSSLADRLLDIGTLRLV